MSTPSPPKTPSPADPQRFDSLNLEFECICIELRSDLSGNLTEIAAGAVASSLGSNWTVERTDESHEFDVSCSNASFAYRQYWEFCYTLEAHEDIEFARPDFDMPDQMETQWSATENSNAGAVLLKTGGNGSNPSETIDYLWALNQCKVPEAWQLIRNAGQKPGDGIVIGHPDSGYRFHSEMDDNRIDKKLQWDFVRSDRDPTNSNGLHGLGTASVIMSGDGGNLKGPALHSTIVPLRVTKKRILHSSLLWPFLNYKNLRRALVYGQDKKFDVISISLGNRMRSFRSKVKKRIKKLNEQGAIVVAAAGNRVTFGPITLSSVMYPGRLLETIAVAGSTYDRSTWSGSCRGSRVDISAPGESVWRATYNANDQQDIIRHSGTSFSTALVAGIAALWKSYRFEELATVEPKHVSDMFRRLIKETAQTDHNLTSKTGAGIIDAFELLKADLPDVSSSDSSSEVQKDPHRETSEKIAVMMESNMSSISPLAGQDLSKLNGLELCELDSAIELELWGYALIPEHRSGLITNDFSAPLLRKITGAA